MFPIALSRPVVLALVSCVVLAVAGPVAAGGESRVMVLRVDDGTYRSMERDPFPPDEVASDTRLVVVRDGRMVADHALVRSEQLGSRRTEGGELRRREDAIIDQAWVNTNGGAAIIVHSRYVVERPMDARNEPDLERYTIVEAEVNVEWIDPQHPYGRWSEDVASGLVLGSVHLMDSGSAVAVVVTDGEQSELYVYGSDGGLRAMQRDLVVANPEVREAADGSTMVIDIAYASRPELPDRALLVVGLDVAGSWIYSWSYGSEQEPVSWALNADGVVQVTTPAFVFRYAADGTPIASERRR